jgi:hypothetical protein
LLSYLYGCNFAGVGGGFHHIQHSSALVHATDNSGVHKSASSDQHRHSPGLPPVQQQPADSNQQTRASSAAAAAAAVTAASPTVSPNAPAPISSPVQQPAAVPSVPPATPSPLSSLVAQSPPKDILVALVNLHFWPFFQGQQWNASCSYQGQPMTCQYVNADSSNTNLTEEQRQKIISRADGLMFHICPGDRPAVARPDAPSVVMTIESPGNNQCMRTVETMQKGHIDMSYRTCAQVRRGWL